MYIRYMFNYKLKSFSNLDKKILNYYSCYN